MKRKLDEHDVLLTKYEGTIWGVSLGDEALEILLGEELIRLAAKSGGDSNPEILRVRELIRMQYGFGKYDLPKSFDSQDQPFHQLATRRFILSKLQQMQKGIWEICQKHRGPDGKKVVSISSTQRADNILTQQSRFANVCDLFCSIGESVAPDCRFLYQIDTRPYRQTGLPMCTC